MQASKRKSQDTADNDSGGYNTDDEGKAARSQNNASKDSTSSRSADDSDDKHPRKKNRLDDMKREERNAREKERTFRISKQINDLRNLLSTGGVIVPKGTKSSVLTEAANYIRMLQQHQYRSEM
jgi:Helix-loop-helix DNA-binding domain